jgi:hypothetical protein
MRKREILRAGSYAYNPYKIVSFKVMGIEQIDRFALEEEQLDLRWAREYLSKFALQRRR